MATIINTPHTAVIIEPDWEKIKEVKIKLGGLKKRKIVIVNIHCLNNQFLNNDFLQIKELIEKSNYLKIFHDGKKEDVDNMIFAFSLRERCDINYIEGVLDKRNIADCYNKYILKTSLI